MDYLDRAADATLAAQEHDTAGLAARAVPQRLNPTELRRLCIHLVETDMSIPAGLAGLGYGIRNLHLDDLDRLARSIARCRHCNTWTRLAELVNGICPDCLEETEGD